MLQLVGRLILLLVIVSVIRRLVIIGEQIRISRK